MLDDYDNIPVGAACSDCRHMANHPSGKPWCEFLAKYVHPYGWCEDYEMHTIKAIKAGKSVEKS